MSSIKDTNFVKTIELNCYKIKKIEQWRIKFNNLEVTTEQLLEDANKILYELIGVNIGFENLIIFNDTTIKSIDTCDEIMKKSLEDFKNKEKEFKENKLSKIINYIWIYFENFATKKYEENIEKLPIINQIIDLVEVKN
tara:strand:- start:93 stop:509 length:417 start_codon:yes stop_codon:yes gene_type:complete